MNLRPLAPKASALPNCATSRFRYSVLFCYGFTQFGFNWKLAPFHSPSALHPDFDIQFCFVIGFTQFGFNWKLAPLHSPSALHPDFDIQFCFVIGFTQFGFNWNLAPFHSPSALGPKSKNFHLAYGSTLSKINVKINRIKICGVC